MGAVERSNNKIYTSKRPQDIPQSPQVPCFLGDTTTSSSIDQALVKLFQHTASLNRHDARNRVLCQPWVPWDPGNTLQTLGTKLTMFATYQISPTNILVLGGHAQNMFIVTFGESSCLYVYTCILCIHVYIYIHTIPCHTIP